MGDLSFLNRSKTNQTQAGVFNLYGQTQAKKKASSSNTKKLYTPSTTSKVQKPTAVSAPNYKSNPLGSGSFFTSRKVPTTKPKKATLTKPSSGAKIGPVYSIGPVLPKTQTFTAPSPTRQAAANVAKVERPRTMGMNRIRSYDSQTRLY